MEGVIKACQRRRGTHSIPQQFNEEDQKHTQPRCFLNTHSLPMIAGELQSTIIILTYVKF